MSRSFTRIAGFCLAVAAGLGCHQTLRVSGAGATVESQAPLASVYFSGFDKIAAAPGRTILKSSLALPEGVEFRRELAQKLGTAWSAHFQSKPGNAETNSAPLLTALVEDALNAESVFEAWPAAGQTPSWGLAVRLDAEHQKTWNGKFKELTAGWTWTDRTRKWSLSQKDQWLVLSLGSGGQSPLAGRLAQNPNLTPAGATNLIDLAVDFPRLSKFSTNTLLARLPAVRLTGRPRNENIRIEGRFQLAAPYPFQLEPWKFPRNIIRDPLISFTAIQGFSSSFKQLDLARKLEIDPAPNQLFFWDNDLVVPLQLQAALPVAGPDAVIRRYIDSILPQANSNLLAMALGRLETSTNKDAVHWQRLPIIVPNVRPVTDAPGSYLKAGIFPINRSPFTNSPPSELFAQFNGRTNLVYYDWEMTQPRLEQMDSLQQLLGIFTTFPTIGNKSPAMKWLKAAVQGNTESITEVTMVSSQELALTRRAALGFNATELVFLTAWLESTNFPSLFPLGFRPPEKNLKVTPPKL